MEKRKKKKIKRWGEVVGREEGDNKRSTTSKKKKRLAFNNAHRLLRAGTASIDAFKTRPEGSLFFNREKTRNKKKNKGGRREEKEKRGGINNDVGIKRLYTLQGLFFFFS